MAFIWDINDNYKQSKNNEYTTIAHSAAVSSSKKSGTLLDNLDTIKNFRNYLRQKILILWSVDQFNFLHVNQNPEEIRDTLGKVWNSLQGDVYSEIKELYTKLADWKLKKDHSWNITKETQINAIITNLIDKMKSSLIDRINIVLKNAKEKLKKDGVKLITLNSDYLQKMILDNNRKMFELSLDIKNFLKNSKSYKKLVDNLKPVVKNSLDFINRRYAKSGNWEGEVVVETELYYFSKTINSENLRMIKKFNTEQLEQLDFRKKELKWKLRKEALNPKLIKNINEIIDVFSKKGDFDSYEDKKNEIITGWNQLEENISLFKKKVGNYLNDIKNNNLKDNLIKINSLINTISDKDEYAAKKEAFSKLKEAFSEWENALRRLNENKKALRAKLINIENKTSDMIKDYFKDTFIKLTIDIYFAQNELSKLNDELSKLKNNIPNYKELIENKLTLTHDLNQLKSKIPNINTYFNKKISSLETSINKIDTKAKYENIKNEFENPINILKNLRREFENLKKEFKLYPLKLKLNKILDSNKKKLNDSRIKNALTDFLNKNKEFKAMENDIDSIQNENDYKDQFNKLSAMKLKIDKYISQRDNKVKIKGKTYELDKNKPIEEQDKILGILAAGLLADSLSGKKNILPGINSKIFKKILDEHKGKKKELINKIKNQIKTKLKNGELGEILKQLNGDGKSKRLQSLIDLYNKKGGGKGFEGIDGKNLESLLKDGRKKYIKEIKDILDTVNTETLTKITKLYKDEKISKEMFDKLKAKLENQKDLLNQIWKRGDSAYYKKYIKDIIKKMHDLNKLNLKHPKKIPKWLANGILKPIRSASLIQVYVSYGIGVVSGSVAVLCSFITLNFLKLKRKGALNIKGKKGLVITSLIIGIISILISVGAFLNGGGIF